MDLVSKHVFNLAQYVYYKLLSLHHANGNPAVILYHDSMFENVDFQGGIVNFNLLRFNGEYIGYAEVTLKIKLNNIQIQCCLRFYISPTCMISICVQDAFVIQELVDTI